MKSFISTCCLIISLTGIIKAQSNDSTIIKSIYTNTLTKSTAYENLRVLCKTIGGRLSGSPQAAKAVDWAKLTMEKDGAPNVWLQECMVPVWKRGAKEIVGTLAKYVEDEI